MTTSSAVFAVQVGALVVFANRSFRATVILPFRLQAT